MNKKLLLALGILALILLAGCVGNRDEETAKQLCTTICQGRTDDLSNGPCLSNNLVGEWVCDVAHDPRQDVDNLPENQCEAYRNGSKTHFVEVTPECELIRTS